jgi:hypothetical protein
VVDYWEVVNEPDPPGVEGDETQGYRRLAELMIKCMERAETYDLNLALFSLNNGTPEWNEMEAMVETGVFAHAQEGGHIMALHEGVAGANEPIDLGWGQGIPGAPEVPGAGTLNFRYRFLYHLLQQRNEVVPLIISEWYCGRYEEPAQEVVEAVSWYDEKGAEDYWLLGHCPFTVGPTSEWEEKGADYTFAYPALRSYMAGISGRQNALPPAGVEGQWVAPQWD